ncbi:MAG: hypothetical protein AAB409_08430 [Gemmatimonadota bacterium]
MMRTLWTAVAALALGAGALAAQDAEDVILEQRSMSGPRLGLTFVAGARARDVLRDRDLAPLLSQFGWHFEQITRPQGGGPMFVIQEVLLLGAVEQQTVVPAGTILFGIRFPSGIEFGMGPNATPVGTALAMGVGWRMQYGGVAVPFNLALVYSPGSVRISVLTGYALRTARRIAR